MINSLGFAKLQINNHTISLKLKYRYIARKDFNFAFKNTEYFQSNNKQLLTFNTWRSQTFTPKEER